MRLLYGDDCSLTIIMRADEKEQQLNFLDNIEDPDNPNEYIQWIRRMIQRSKELQ